LVRRERRERSDPLTRSTGRPGLATPFGPRSHGRREAVPVVPSLAVLTMALGIVCEWAFARTGAAPIDLARDLLVGYAFVAAGLVAWRRQPAVRWWALMLIEAVAWFLLNRLG